MVNLVIRINHDSFGSPHYFGESFPTKLSMTEWTLSAYLVSVHLPLKLNVSVRPFAELTAKHPASHEWPNCEPIDACIQECQ